MHVARSTGNQPPSFDLSPLATSETRPERYLDWFRRFVEVRAEEAAERTLRTAIHIGLPPRGVAEMIFAACTDHLFLDVGHSLDFANKAFELLDHIGWEHAGEVLPSIVPNLVRAQRMEESSSWRHPVDLAQLLVGGPRELDRATEEGAGRLGLGGPPGSRGDNPRPRAGRDPGEDAGSGAPGRAPGRARRQRWPMPRRAGTLHFHVSNEFGDWDTVHHTFTYANAVNQAMRRAPSPLLARGIFDGAMAVYLGRYLNVPKQPIPSPSAGRPTREACWPPSMSRVRSTRRPASSPMSWPRAATARW